MAAAALLASSFSGREEAEAEEEVEGSDIEEEGGRWSMQAVTDDSLL